LLFLLLVYMFDFEGSSRSAKEMGTLNTPKKVTSQREKERETCIYLSIGGFVVLLQDASGHLSPPLNTKFCYSWSASFTNALSRNAPSQEWRSEMDLQFCYSWSVWFTNAHLEKHPSQEWWSEMDLQFCYSCAKSQAL